MSVRSRAETDEWIPKNIFVSCRKIEKVYSKKWDEYFLVVLKLEKERIRQTKQMRIVRAFLQFYIRGNDLALKKNPSRKIRTGKR